MLMTVGALYLVVYEICSPRTGECDDWVPEQQPTSYAECKREERRMNARLPDGTTAHCEPETSAERIRRGSRYSAF